MSNQDGPGDVPAEPSAEPAVIRIERRGTENAAQDIALHDRVQGRKPGSRFLRLTRFRDQKLRRTNSGEFQAMEAALKPRTPVGRLGAALRHAILGAPLPSSGLEQEKLSKLKALAIFSSDNLSSSAYATEEILLVLILAGSGALHLSLPIAVAIAALAGIVATSYRQLVRAYPGGGGAYEVTKENLGYGASLLIGSTLFVDYILTVAVSTAAGVAAITSAVPELHGVHVELAVAFVFLLSLGNLRGIREAGSLFALPSYLFIFSFGGMLLFGLVRLALGHDLSASAPLNPVEEGSEALSGLLLLRAFASGAAALTGIEAIADGVPSFKAPEAKNASTTLTWMASILAAFFLGTTFLAIHLDVVPSESTTVVAQIAQSVFGKNVLFYLIQVATAMILVLAANTAFAGLPTLASVMAKDGVAPKRFAFVGDRLAFSNGIIVLGIASSIVLVLFKAETHKIIPLYALGVFLAFTLSQSAMVIHWLRTRSPGWRFALGVNAAGAIVTAAVTVIVVGTKFMNGAWLSLTAMGLILYVLIQIRLHYRSVSSQLNTGVQGNEAILDTFYRASARPTLLPLVPIEGINRATLRAVTYARRISPTATAIHVSHDREVGARLRVEWRDKIPDVPLVVIESTAGSFTDAVLSYVEALQRTDANRFIVVVLADIRGKHGWDSFLENSQSNRLKSELMERSRIVIASVPYELDG